MNKMERRPFLGAALAGFPFSLLAQNLDKPKPAESPLVSRGNDRLGEQHTIGVSSTNFKVITRDTAGGLFIMEHTNRKKGGPPLHLHHNEDEWFYPIEGEYLIAVGSERYRARAGDSILVPRKTAHTWAFVGETPGRMLIGFAPAGKMESFFRDTEKHHDKGIYVNDAEVYRGYGMELLGAPLKLE